MKNSSILDHVKSVKKSKMQQKQKQLLSSSSQPQLPHSKKSDEKVDLDLIKP